MGPLIIERLNAVLPARVQKIALRVFDNEVPSIFLTLYQGDKFYVGFLGSELYGLNVPCETDVWRNAAPSKNQAAFRHHLINTELSALQSMLGLWVMDFKHKDGKKRQLVIEPGKKGYCLLLLQYRDENGRIIAFHGAQEDKTKRRKVGQIYALPDSPLNPLSPQSTKKQTVSQPMDPQKRRLLLEKKRLLRLQKNLKKDVQKLGEPNRLYAQGHVLMGHLDSVIKGQKEVTLETGDAQALTIDLRPDKTPVQNMELKFSKAKKAQRGLEKIKPRLIALEVRFRIIQDLMAQEDLRVEDVDQVLSKKALAPSARRKAALQGKALPWRRFQITDEAFVWVGKNARGNDALTFHHAKGKDIWMHIRDASGAHVIVPARFIKEMKVVEGAAQLAAHFSPLRHDTRVDIRRTERKNLRKPGKGAAPGRVLVSAEENMTITPDPSWVIEILRQEKPA
jgi:predicted ribosome quality control (RQC) complex YloA/Tae2 family protein